jgi:hypothetical protein
VPAGLDLVRHARDAELFGVNVPVLAAEEMIWSKVFVAERHRYDGADIAHLFRAAATTMDWSRLLARFGSYWPLLLTSLILFGFIYPADRSKIPDWLSRELASRWQRDSSTSGPQICQGTLLSSTQFLHDLNHGSLLDARVQPIGKLAADHVND